MTTDAARPETQGPAPAAGLARWRTGMLLGMVMLLWLVTRPYMGIVQDARFYMLEALNQLDPARFAEDLYFKFGSQGSFTLFSHLYAPLVQVLGIGMAGMVATLAGQALWLAGLLRLARTLVGPRLMWLSVAVVVGLLHIYAPYFGYGEGFATPRLFAEGLTMMALSLLAARPVWAFGLLALAASLHPLMALPGIAVAFVYLALGQPLWWAAAAAGIGLALVLGLAGLAPFSNLFRTIDPEWFAILQTRVIQCLITRWPLDSLLQVAGVFGWAFAALFTVGRPHRRFLGAVIIVGVGGLLCTWLLGDIGRNLFIVEVQSWRALWLLQLVSRLYIPLIFLSLLATSSFDAFRMASLLSMTMILVSGLTRLMRFPAAAEFTPLSLVLVAAALAVMAVLLLVEAPRRQRLVLVAALAGLCLIPLALWRWDARVPWTRFVESPAPVPKTLEALLPPAASLYWENSTEMLWLKLQRPSYFSCDQGTGAVFYRETAMAYRHRQASFWPLRTGDFAQSDICASLDPLPAPSRNRTGLQRLCRREPALDYLVLTAPLDGVAANIWTAPVSYQETHKPDGRITNRFYIYGCAGVR